MLPYNNLNGTIPSELGLLPNIWELDLSNNKLVGSVPSELGQLTTLCKCFRRKTFTTTLHRVGLHACCTDRLRIEMSYLTGSVPSEICELRRGLGRGQLVEFVNSCNDVACAQPECCSLCHETANRVM